MSFESFFKQMKFRILFVGSLEITSFCKQVRVKDLFEKRFSNSVKAHTAFTRLLRVWCRRMCFRILASICLDIGLYNFGYGPLYFWILGNYIVGFCRLYFWVSDIDVMPSPQPPIQLQLASWIEYALQSANTMPQTLPTISQLSGGKHTQSWSEDEWNVHSESRAQMWS